MAGRIRSLSALYPLSICSLSQQEKNRPLQMEYRQGYQDGMMLPVSIYLERLRLQENCLPGQAG